MLFLSGLRKPTPRVREVSALSEKQCGSTCTTNTENPSILDCTKKRKTLFNSRENSLLVQVPDVQVRKWKERKKIEI